MPTRTNRTGDLVPADTTTIHRTGARENPAGRLDAGQADFSTPNHTTQPPNGPHIANAEAVSAGAGPKASPGQEIAPGVGSADISAGFLTAAGSRDSHATTLADGRPNRSPKAGKPYQRITWADIRTLVDSPSARPKDRANLVILSAYAEADGRTHAVQRERGVFGGLAVDIDSGNPSMEAVVAAVVVATGGAAAEVYSSSSAKPDNRKWRVLVPLATPVAGADYADTQEALFQLLEAHGLVVDHTLTRAAQPVYLPNVPPEKRGPDGRPLFYQSCHVPGPTLELVDGHPIVERRRQLAEEAARLEAERAERAAAYRAKRLAHVAATGDDFEPIAHFNATHTVADLLARYGFTRREGGRGNHYKSPLGESGSYSTEDRGDHWVSLSQWAHSHNVGRATRKGFRSGDAFDLFAYFEHGGDRSAAVRAYAEEVRPRLPATKPAAPELPPAGRVEPLEVPPTVPLDELRAELRRDLAAAVEKMPPLVVVTAGTGVGKTEAAVEKLAAAYDKLVWAVGTHDNATETVARLKAAGHEDVGAIPPRDHTTCRCWTAEDAARLADEYPGYRHMIPMESAIRVGSPHIACLACPLSGLVKAPPVAVPDDAFAAFSDPNAIYWTQPEAEPAEADGCRCEYWRRKREAEACRVTVMCQARFLKTELSPAPIGTTRAVVVDEHGTAALFPRHDIDLATMRATRDALGVAVDTWRQRKGKMRFSRAREIEHELLQFGEGVRGVAESIVSHMETLEAAGQRHVGPLPDFSLPAAKIPKRTHTKIARLLVNATLPAAFDSDALDFVRRVAAGKVTGAAVQVDQLPNGSARVQIVVGRGAAARQLHAMSRPAAERAETLENMAAAAEATGGGRETMFVVDADADMAAIRKAFPNVLEVAPRGRAPLAHVARQWWLEINPSTHPSVVVRMLELAIREHGFKKAGVVMCKSHRDLLFPVTRPRGGRLAEDKEPDPERIANWGGRGGRELAEGTAEQRMARAVALVERVRRLREFIARDEHGRLLVEHHRGTSTRGSNRFIVDTDGGVVLGHTRVNPGCVSSYMLCTARGAAVERSNGGWGDVEGELPAVGGGVSTRRWRGYTCPEWAEAARLLNRAELTQTAARFRATLRDTGKPVVVVAAEPTGLPVMDPPATLPEGVATVVAAVRELVSRTKVVPACEDRKTAPRGVEPAQLAGGRSPDGRESGKRSIGHTSVPSFIGGLPDTPGVSLRDVCQATGAPERTARLWLADAVARGLLERRGAARATRYGLPTAKPVAALPPAAAAPCSSAVQEVCISGGSRIMGGLGGFPRTRATPPPLPPAARPLPELPPTHRSVVAGLVYTDDGPRLTDAAAEVLLGSMRTPLVDAIASSWRRRATPNAPSHVRDEEAIDFICELFSTPPPTG